MHVHVYLWATEEYANQFTADLTLNSYSPLQVHAICVVGIPKNFLPTHVLKQIV